MSYACNDCVVGDCGQAPPEPVDPTPTPDEPSPTDTQTEYCGGNPYFCCAESACNDSAEGAPLECAEGAIPCCVCDVPSPQGQVRVWFFYDSNRNHQFDQEDQALPSEVVTNARLRLHLTNKTCVDGQGQIIPCYEYIATGHSIPEGPGIAGELVDNRCADSWGEFGECCPIDEPDCNSNEVCCNHDPTFFNTCWGTCQDNNRAGSDGWTKDVNGVVDNIGDWWFKDTLFWGYYMGDDPSNEYLNYDNHKLATGTWGGYIADTGDGGGVNYAVVDLPEGYEVSVIRNQEPMDATQQTTVEDQSYLDSRYIDGVGDNVVTQELVVVGIAPENDPPQVRNSKVEQVGEQPFNTYTASYCHSPSSQTEITLFSHYYDADEPASQINLVDNPSFEQPLDGWTLHAADPDNTYNPAPHETGVTDTVSFFGNQSAYVYKGAETSWGPQINYALPTLTIGQTYAFSVWAKTPQSAQFILQNTPVESCDGTDSDLDYSNYNSLKSESVSGSQDWQPLEFVYTPKNECETYTNIILSAAGSSINDTVYFDGVSVTQTISETEGELIYPFSDIKHFQINLENNDATEDINGNLTGAYDSGQWPIRIFANIAETSNQSPYYELRHGPNGDVARTLIKYDFLENKWYLDQNLTIQNSSGVNVATLLSSDPNPINPDWQTYFELVKGVDGKWDNIFALWQLQLHEGFTADNYHVTSHVKDFLNQEDTRETYETEGYSRQRLYLTFGASSSAYWQRIGQLNAITPQLTAHFYEDANATQEFDGTCSGSTANTATLTGNSVQVEDLDPAVSQISEATINNQNSVTFTPPSCTSSDGYNITLNLDSSAPVDQHYVCACSQGSDPYTCLYPNVDLNFLDENPQAINFFVQQADLSHGPWFQSVGGNTLAMGDILSYVPFDGSGPCDPTLGCEPALLTSLPWSSDNADTPGFPLASETVDTIDGTGEYSNIHNGNRSQSDDGRAEGLTVQLPQRGYTYYYNKFGFDGETLSNNIMPTGLSTSDLNVYQYTGDLTISDTHSWNVPNDVKLVVFVNGNLTFSGSDSNITNVEQGGFLAFIVNGTITIDSSVGHSMSAGVAEAASNTPDTATSNLEGVFIAQNITVQSAGPTEIDKKLIAEGTFVGWNSITLARNFANEGGLGATHNMYNPTETFIHRPDLVINMPVEMKEALHEWREVNPSKE